MNEELESTSTHVPSFVTTFSVSTKQETTIVDAKTTVSHATSKENSTVSPQRETSKPVQPLTDSTQTFGSFSQKNIFLCFNKKHSFAQKKTLS